MAPAQQTPNVAGPALMTQAAARPVRAPTGSDLLNANEMRLLEWLAAGRTNAQIGTCSGRSEKTIRNQLTRVYAKLGVVNRAAAVAVYLRSQLGTQPWVDPPRSLPPQLQDRDIRPIGESHHVA